MPRQNSDTSRLAEVDALRGIAAMSVVLFHYTTRFTELFAPPYSPTISFQNGHYGVNLFFIISGFVIFMTLERTSKPMDFVISRFSRLFPAYWFAIFLTYSITQIIGLPGKTVDMSTAISNMVMIHGLFRIPHVDGVYWTLEVEFLFYCGMLTLYRLRLLHFIHYVLLTLLALRLVYHLMAHTLEIDLPWTISRLLILEYIPWFALGISIYISTSRQQGKSLSRPIVIASCATLTLLIVDSLFIALLAAAFSTIVFLAVIGRAPILRLPVLIWLGSISYPLYLLHENIGWSIELRLLAAGLPIDGAIVLTLGFSLALATIVTYCVEQPAMRWIRDRYHARFATQQ